MTFGTVGPLPFSQLELRKLALVEERPSLEGIELSSSIDGSILFGGDGFPPSSDFISKMKELP